MQLSYTGVLQGMLPLSYARRGRRQKPVGSVDGTNEGNDLFHEHIIVVREGTQIYKRVIEHRKWEMMKIAPLFMAVCGVMIKLVKVGLYLQEMIMKIHAEWKKLVVFLNCISFAGL
jgi:hypothetical protein